PPVEPAPDRGRRTRRVGPYRPVAGSSGGIRMTGMPLPGSVPSPPVVDAPAARPVEKRTDRGTFEKHLDTPARNAPGHGVSDAHAAPSLQPANAGAQAPIDR